MVLLSCAEIKEAPATDRSMGGEPLINLQHFNHLYKEISIAGDTMAIMHIYSEYPDYDYAIEPSEGFTCVDDVARAVVFLSEYYKTGKAPEGTLHQIAMLVKFVLHLQHKNGYFNNFIWHDLSVNTEYKTSVATLNWWSLRAFWALETAFPLLQNDTHLSARISLAIEKLMANIKRDLTPLPMVQDTVNTLPTPTWLPSQSAADQAAVLVLALLPYYQRTGDPTAQNLVDVMAKGIMQMQKGGEGQYPYGAFLSWGNLWHAWGNSQAYALLKAGQVFNNETYIKSALLEVDHFYPYLLENGLAEAFWVEQEAAHLTEVKRNAFPQIAYGIRPMVWAATEAYQVTKQEKYLALADTLTSWFLGNNVARRVMYDAATGRAYDGIISENNINQNSGAESTIECLLTLLKIH